MKEIRSTAITEQWVSDFVKNIWQADHTYGGETDDSFLSTARTLLFNRVKDKSVAIHLTSFVLSSNDINNYTIKDNIDFLGQCVIKEDAGGSQDSNITSIQINKTNDIGFNFLHEQFLKVFPDFISIPKITSYYKKEFPVEVYIRPSDNKVFVNCRLKNISDFQILSCSIPVMLPWFFNGENALTDNEKGMINDIREHNIDKYLKYIEDFVEAMNFKTRYIKENIAGISNYGRQRRINLLTDKIKNNNIAIGTHERSIQLLWKDILTYQNELSGLVQSLNETSEADEDLADYLIHNKSVSIRNVVNSKLVFDTKTYLNIFDTSMAEVMINNTNSVLYRYNLTPYRSESFVPRMQALLKAVFLDQTLKICSVARFELDFDGGCSPCMSSSFDQSTLSHYVPNPHINNFGCMGGYNTIISQMLRDARYIEIVEQCIASCQSLNFGDAVVIKNFMKTIHAYYDNDEFAIIETNDGEKLSVREAIEWAESQEVKTGDE